MQARITGFDSGLLRPAVYLGFVLKHAVDKDFSA